jgi:predicted unusual protein kinase regulating ubiquinone biosynthesis (AarF/ABC1/UbiB family)
VKILILRLQIIVLSLACSLTVFAGQKSKQPLYLSYEQRLVFSYLLAGSNESAEKQTQIVRRMEQTLQHWLQMPPRTIHVSNFKDFLEAYQGPWPKSYSLESDLQLIERSELRGPVRIEATSTHLQKQIDRFILSQNSNLVQRATQDITPAESAVMALPSIASLMESRNRTQWIHNAFALISDLLTTQFKQIQKTGEEMAQSGKMAGVDEALNLFMKKVFQEYFGRLSLETKKQILSQMAGHDLNMGLQQRFELMVLSAGPQFQKLLQIVAREAGISQDLLKTFQQLESKAQPIPALLVRDLFESERDRYHWLSYELTPLGTGTMAQVHRGRIEVNGQPQDVVIRFLKPEIEKRVQEDYRILSEIAPLMDKDPRFRQLGFPKLTPVVIDLNRTVTDELNLSATIERQKLARRVYPRELPFFSNGYKNVIEIHVPQVFQTDASSRLQVQELVHGEKLDQVANFYKSAMPDFKKSIAETMARLWVEEVMYGSGFFHSDLHQGNFLVDFTEPKITINLLDFGMGGVISRPTQLQMMELGAGIDLSRADLIGESFWALSLHDQNTLSKNDFLSQVLERVKAIQSGKLAWQPITAWTTWAMDQGLRFPYEFVSLNRGMVILDKLLKDSGSSLNLTKVARRLAITHAVKTIANLRNTKKISWMDLLKLGLVSKNSRPNPAAVSNEMPVSSTSLQCRGVFLSH